MKISVITVCFNSARSLERALQSVLDQDWPDVESIVIDGASTDGTTDILQRWRPRLTQVISEPDRGIYDAMNKGLDRATGEIICFLNADDQYANAYILSRVVRQMKTQQLDALLGDVAYFAANNPNRILRRYRADHFHPVRLAYGWMPAHPALFLHRSVIQRVGRFKIDYQIAGDFEYIVRIFHQQSLRYQHLPEVLVLMQHGGASSTNSWRKKVLHNRELLRACRENGLRTHLAKILLRYPLKLLELGPVHANRDSDNR